MCDEVVANDCVQVLLVCADDITSHADAAWLPKQIGGMPASHSPALDDAIIDDMEQSRLLLGVQHMSLQYQFVLFRETVFAQKGNADAVRLLKPY